MASYLSADSQEAKMEANALAANAVNPEAW